MYKGAGLVAVTSQQTPKLKTTARDRYGTGVLFDRDQDVD